MKQLTAVAKAASTNPFYGMRAMLTLLQQMPKLGSDPQKNQVFNLLNNAYAEVGNDLDKKKLFYSLFFSFGDITNRQHNLFRKSGLKDVDDGGQSMRKLFSYSLEWLLAINPNQYYRFLPILGEYYNLDAVGMLYQNTTDRFKGTLKETLKLNVDLDRITTFIADALKNTRTTENERKLWAKWLWHIPTNNRKRKFTVTEKGLKSVQKKYGKDYKVGDVITGKRDKQAFTTTKDKWTIDAIDMLSTKMDWLVIKHPQNSEYVGYKNFKKKYLVDSEATMFSQGTIRKLDKTQLFEWFDQLPSGAKFRTQCRLVQKDEKTGVLTAKDKWINDNRENIGLIYLDWLNSKEKAQQVMRELTVEDKVKLQTESPDVLKQMEKAAKVNTGATTMVDLFVEMFKPATNDTDVNTRAYSLLEKVKIELPVFICTDNSGSMTSGSLTHNGVNFSARSMAALATTIFMLKNPDENSQNMFITFDSNARVITKGVNAPFKDFNANNRFMSVSQRIVPELIDKTKPFIYNYNNVSQFLTNTGGSTNVSSISKELKRWVDSEPAVKNIRIEQILAYPVFLFIGDGDFNSYGTTNQSILVFRQEMKQWFGWEGLTVLWDVKQTGDSSSKFEGIDNTMYFGGYNTSILNQIFRNISDIDIIDVYMPLDAMYKSNRYAPVRDLVS